MPPAQKPSLSYTYFIAGNWMPCFPVTRQSSTAIFSGAEREAVARHYQHARI